MMEQLLKKRARKLELEYRPYKQTSETATSIYCLLRKRKKGGLKSGRPSISQLDEIIELKNYENGSNNENVNSDCDGNEVKKTKNEEEKKRKNRWM
jgi:hypothetical protein